MAKQKKAAKKKPARAKATAKPKRAPQPKREVAAAAARKQPPAVEYSDLRKVMLASVLKRLT